MEQNKTELKEKLIALILNEREDECYEKRHTDNKEFIKILVNLLKTTSNEEFEEILNDVLTKVEE